MVRHLLPASASSPRVPSRGSAASTWNRAPPRRGSTTASPCPSPFPSAGRGPRHRRDAGDHPALERREHGQPAHASPGATVYIPSRFRAPTSRSGTPHPRHGLRIEAPLPRTPEVPTRNPNRTPVPTRSRIRPRPGQEQHPQSLERHDPAEDPHRPLPSGAVVEIFTKEASDGQITHSRPPRKTSRTRGLRHYGMPRH